MSEMSKPPEFPKGHRPQVFDDPSIDREAAAGLEALARRVAWRNT